MQEALVWSLGQEDPLEREMATHSNMLAWEISWTEKPGGLHTVHGSQRVGHDLVTKQQQRITPNLLSVKSPSLLISFMLWYYLVFWSQTLNALNNIHLFKKYLLTLQLAHALLVCDGCINMGDFYNFFIFS